MAFDIDYFLKINNTYGATSDKDVQLYNLKSQVNDRFTDTIDYYKVKINDVDRDILIVRTVNQDEKKIKSRPDEDFNVGDYVVLDNKTWLVMTKDVCNQAYTTGLMKLTNYTLTFQHPTTGAIISQPCITSSTRLGQEENKYMTLGNNEKSITLPYNQTTILLGIDKRLYVDLNNKQAYKIISIDNTSHKGLIELIVEQDLIQNDSEHPDRPDLGICNYIEPTISVDPPQGDTYSTINATNMILGITNEITPTFYNSDGTINSTIVAVWNIIKPVGYESDITISTNGNICNISLSDNYDLLGKTVVATVSDGNGEYKSTTELTIGMGW